MCAQFGGPKKQNLSARNGVDIVISEATSVKEGPTVLQIRTLRNKVGLRP